MYAFVWVVNERIHLDYKHPSVRRATNHDTLRCPGQARRRQGENNDIARNKNKKRSHHQRMGVSVPTTAGGEATNLDFPPSGPSAHEYVPAVP